MKNIALSEYTKDKKLIGQNSIEVLDKFLEYISLCKDPLHIYTYMQQKSICVYLAHYWISKAKYLAQIGDYRDAFECLKQAISRTNIINEEQINFELEKRKILQSLLINIKKYQLKSKRTVEQYTLLNQVNIKQINEQTISKILNLYDKKYILLQKQLELNYLKNRQQRQYSWMYNQYKIKQQKIKKVQQRIKSITNYNHSDSIIQKCQSMKTPIKRKDVMRLTKTLDSVQMLKKKKLAKSQEKQQFKNLQNNQEFNYNSLPVGKGFSDLKRVTFSIENSQIQKIRHDDSIIDNQNSKLYKRENSSNGILKTKSALRNPHTQSDNDNDDDL